MAEWHEGDVIRKLRASRGWTLLELADVADVNVAVIFRLEDGQTKDPRKATLERIAEALGVTVQQLRNWVPPGRLPSAAELTPKREPSKHAKKTGHARAVAEAREKQRKRRAS